MLAVSGRWKFRTQVSDESSNVSDDEKTRRVVIQKRFFRNFKKIAQNMMPISCISTLKN
ncbi:MAG: hypothetical protein ACRCZO_14835 [Cetobacterium sp.]|uniref:hypothetical protein n=1 Tax=Cetobacterium sp. TaxID=2071632 RepID=UPI003F2CEEE6